MLARLSMSSTKLKIFLLPCLLGHGRLAITMNKASKAAQMLSKLGASKGGKERAKILTPERRKQIAQKAAKARWGKDTKAGV